MFYCRSKEFRFARAYFSLVYMYHKSNCLNNYKDIISTKHQTTGVKSKKKQKFPEQVNKRKYNSKVTQYLLIYYWVFHKSSIGNGNSEVISPFLHNFWDLEVHFWATLTIFTTYRKL